MSLLNKPIVRPVVPEKVVDQHEVPGKIAPMRVMVAVVLGAVLKGQNRERHPRKLIPRMPLDSVHLAPPDPGQEREKVHLLPENQRSGGQRNRVPEQKLDWVRVGGAESHCH